MLIRLINSIFQKTNKNETKVKNKGKKLTKIENKDLFVVANIKIITGEELVCYYRPTTEEDKVLIGAPMVMNQVAVSIEDNVPKMINALTPWSLITPIEERYLNTEDIISIVVLEGPRMSMTQVQIVNEYKINVQKIIAEEARKIDEYMHKNHNLLLNKLKLEKIYHDPEKERDD